MLTFADGLVLAEIASVLRAMSIVLEKKKVTWWFRRDKGKDIAEDPESEAKLHRQNRRKTLAHQHREEHLNVGIVKSRVQLYIVRLVRYCPLWALTKPAWIYFWFPSQKASYY